MEIIVKLITCSHAPEALISSFASKNILNFNMWSTYIRGIFKTQFIPSTQFHSNSSALPNILLICKFLLSFL